MMEWNDGPPTSPASPKILWWLLVIAAALATFTGCKIDALATPCVDKRDYQYYPLIVETGTKVDTLLLVTCKGPFKPVVFPKAGT